MLNFCVQLTMTIALVVLSVMIVTTPAAILAISICAILAAISMAIENLYKHITMARLLRISTSVFRWVYYFREGPLSLFLLLGPSKSPAVINSCIMAVVLTTIVDHASTFLAITQMVLLTAFKSLPYLYRFREGVLALVFLLGSPGPTFINFCVLAVVLSAIFDHFSSCMAMMGIAGKIISRSLPWLYRFREAVVTLFLLLSFPDSSFLINFCVMAVVLSAIFDHFSFSWAMKAVPRKNMIRSLCLVYQLHEAALTLCLWLSSPRPVLAPNNCAVSLLYPHVSETSWPRVSSRLFTSRPLSIATGPLFTPLNASKAADPSPIENAAKHHVAEKATQFPERTINTSDASDSNAVVSCPQPTQTVLAAPTPDESNLLHVFLFNRVNSEVENSAIESSNDAASDVSNSPERKLSPEAQTPSAAASTPESEPFQREETPSSDIPSKGSLSPSESFEAAGKGEPTGPSSEQAPESAGANVADQAHAGSDSGSAKDRGLLHVFLFPRENFATKSQPLQAGADTESASSEETATGKQSAPSVPSTPFKFDTTCFFGFGLGSRADNQKPTTNLDLGFAPFKPTAKADQATSSTAKSLAAESTFKFGSQATCDWQFKNKSGITGKFADGFGSQTAFGIPCLQAPQQASETSLIVSTSEALPDKVASKDDGNEQQAGESTPEAKAVYAGPFKQLEGGRRALPRGEKPKKLQASTNKPKAVVEEVKVEAVEEANGVADKLAGGEEYPLDEELSPAALKRRERNRKKRYQRVESLKRKKQALLAEEGPAGIADGSKAAELEKPAVEEEEEDVAAAAAAAADNEPTPSAEPMVAEVAIEEEERCADEESSPSAETTAAEAEDPKTPSPCKRASDSWTPEFRARVQAAQAADAAAWSSERRQASRTIFDSPDTMSGWSSPGSPSPKTLSGGADWAEMVEEDLGEEEGFAGGNALPTIFEESEGEGEE